VGEFLAWMEASRLGHAMRETGVWTYPLVNLAHVLGIASLFGSILVLDLRLLGCWPRIPIKSVTAAVTPVAGSGLALALVSGAGLLAATATDYAGNPFLLLKFIAVALGLMNVAIVRRSRGWRAHDAHDLSPGERRQMSVLGGISLVCWTTAVAAGRLIAYW
jgi:hypothetical protein